MSHYQTQGSEYPLTKTDLEKPVIAQWNTVFKLKYNSPPLGYIIETFDRNASSYTFKKSDMIGFSSE